MGPLHIVMLFIHNEDIADVNLKKIDCLMP